MSRQQPSRSSLRNSVASPTSPLSPLSPHQVSRSPDATPVPSNPNLKLATSIPSRSQASRRTGPPSSFGGKASELAMSSTKPPPVANANARPGPNGSRRTNSVAGSMRSMRTTSMHSMSGVGVNGTGLKGKGAPPSAAGKPKRSSSVNLTSTKTVEPQKSPVIARSGPRASMESVTVVSPATRPSPNTPARQTTPARTRTMSTPNQSPANEKRLHTGAAISPAQFRAIATPIKQGPPPFSPKTSTPQTPGVVVHRSDPHETPKSTPSKPTRPPLATIVPALQARPDSSASLELSGPAVPWTSSGTLHPPNGSHKGPPRSRSGRSVGDASYVTRSMGPGLYGDDDYDYGQNGYGYVNEGGTTDGGDMTLDMITDVDENEFDEDLQEAFEELRHTFMRKLIHYKRLLEQSQASAASQLHALQAELRLLRVQVESERKTMRDLEIRAGRDREALFTERRHRSQMQLDITAGGGVFDIAALRGDGRGSFDEAEVKRVVRSLRLSDRMRLIHLILDSCLPGDISQMIRLLEKYAASTLDIIAMLPQELSAKILSYLTIPELLEVECVSKAWQAVVHHPSIWRQHCLELTWSDPVPLKWPRDANEWEPLYKALHHRERNFALGLAQSVRFLRGHTNFCTTLIFKGNRLISGSYDETIRVWDVAAGKETHCLKAKAISCLDFLPEEEVLVAGFHDVGRVQVYSTVTWTQLQTLQGHLYGIRSVAISKKYVVSAGADKAIVCWDWRAGQKIVRFGQQTNLNIGVQIVDDETVVGVTVDGIVRTFSIRRKEMISQFKLNELAAGDPLTSARLSQVGVGANNMLQWFAAKGRQMTCATKNVILHLEWEENKKAKDKKSEILTPTTENTPSPTSSSLRHSVAGRPSTATSMRSPLTSRKSLGATTPSRTGASPRASAASRLGMSPRSVNGLADTEPTSIMTAPPKLLSVVETPDVAVGAVDPLKRRVTTATRFSTRAGADRRIFLSTYKERRKPGTPTEDEPEPVTPSDMSMDLTTDIATIGGAWAMLADGPAPEGTPGIGRLPPDFKGLATPGLNPMSMALSHEEVVVGCADGTIYVMSFPGWEYSKPAEEELLEDALDEEQGSE
ncbi:hypothetical protein FRC04_003126 [Tulasnella sp. 424]|nr:hypothetical protein FRC04_003126 [Tulasnella sp. 424]